jgi:hypothetical protein
MRLESTNAVGSTRVSRVQFPDASGPNCHGAYAIGFAGADSGNLHWQTVSGATPETTRETRVPPKSIRVFALLLSI